MPTTRDAPNAPPAAAPAPPAKSERRPGGKGAPGGARPSTKSDTATLEIERLRAEMRDREAAFKAEARQRESAIKAAEERRIAALKAEYPALGEEVYKLLRGNRGDAVLAALRPFLGAVRGDRRGLFSTGIVLADLADEPTAEPAEPDSDGATPSESAEAVETV